MLRAGGLIGLLFLVGCHGPSVVVSRPAVRPTAIPVEANLESVTPTRIEPQLDNVATLDAKMVDPARFFAADGASFRGLNESNCLLLAAARSPMGNLLDSENQKPNIGFQIGKRTCPDTKSAELSSELRYLLAAEMRHRDAAEALDRFYQLADAEARTELLTTGLKTFDELRALSPQARSAGLPVPEEDEQTRQRAKLLGEVESAESGIKLLNVELQTRLGLSVKGTERLWPTGSFEIRPEPLDVEEAVRIALESRADLKLLRTLYHGANTETLPLLENYLRTVNPLTGSSTSVQPVPFAIRQSRTLTAKLKSATQQEVEIRKQQLFELTAEREKLAAAEVRMAAVQMASAVRRIALAKGRADSWKARIDKSDKPLDRLPHVLEWLKARAEIVQEVMTWHRWHTKFRAAQGTLIPAPQTTSSPSPMASQSTYVNSLAARSD